MNAVRHAKEMDRMFTRFACTAALAAGLFVSAAWADDDDDRRDNNSNCAGMPGEAQLRAWLKAAPSNGGTVGGLFNGARMWGAIVNRDGEVCAVAASQDDRKQVWPGSLAIAKSKAYTANAFSLDNLALSTARLYTFTQPGHSLWSLGQSNLFDPRFLAPPSNSSEGKNHIAGGLIFFGGGVPLYRNGRIIGGLGVSGDTSCADHEVAKRVRAMAGMNPALGAAADDITYTAADGASVFTHPLCINTFRNGAFIGNEPPAVGY
jgi:uncharacterized protein GlcG (DUF336 family)